MSTKISQEMKKKNRNRYALHNDNVVDVDKNESRGDMLGVMKVKLQ